MQIKITDKTGTEGVVIVADRDAVGDVLTGWFPQPTADITVTIADIVRKLGSESIEGELAYLGITVEYVD
jgi:hypothetical protein